jgi:hypothetical protein
MRKSKRMAQSSDDDIVSMLEDIREGAFMRCNRGEMVGHVT